MNTHIKKDRILWLDTVKLLAIFLVLWGHCAQHLLTCEEWSNYIYIYIYSFHMPLFMVISGFFAGNIFKHSFFEVMKNKTWQLIVPVVLWGTLLYVIDTYMISNNTTSYLNSILWRYFWFLKSLFICFILFSIGTYWIRNKNAGLIIVLIISQFIVYYKIRYMFPCFVFGYIINRNLGFFKKHIWPIFIISGIVYFLMVPEWDVHKMWPSVSKAQLLITPLYSLYQVYFKLIIGIAGSLVCICACYILFKDISTKGTTSRICELGQYTLSIYIIQSLLLETILAHIINIDSVNDWRLNFVMFPVLSVCILLMCIQMHKYMLKNPVMKFLIQPSWKALSDMRRMFSYHNS